MQNFFRIEFKGIEGRIIRIMLLFCNLNLREQSILIGISVILLWYIEGSFGSFYQKDKNTWDLEIQDLLKTNPQSTDRLFLRKLLW